MTQVNTIGWFDLYVSDMERAKAFYETVFDVELNDMSDPTGETEMMGFPMDDQSMSKYGAVGALVKMDGVKPGPGGTIVYFNSQDCSIEEARVNDAGGKVIRPKFSIGEYGWIGLCEDTEGNIFGLHSTT